MLTDPISDMLTRIRNATMARHERVSVPASRLKRAVAEILASEGYVASIQTESGDDGRESLTLVYVACDDIAKVRSGLGISVLSTSRGVMSDREARKQGVGGELLCEVW